jgi:hypothetical protein
MANDLTTPIQRLLEAKNLIVQALPDETPEARLQMIGLMLLGPAVPDTVKPAKSKSDQLIDMLGRPHGATIDEVVEAFGIKKNSAYARISVESRKRKLNVENRDGRYHIAGSKGRARAHA